MDIRKRTKLIVKRGNQFLVALTSITKQPKWSVSPYDAWGTKELLKAKKVAEYFNAKIYMFNPCVGMMREYRDGE